MFVIRTTEHKLFFLKVVQKMDSFKVVTLSSFSDNEHVLSCLELERSRFLATGGLGGKIKVWDISKQTPKFMTSLEDYGVGKNRDNEDSELYIRRKISKEEKGVVKMIYTPKGPGLLLSLGFENCIVVWSPDTSLSKSYIGRLEGHTAIIKDMVFVKNTFLVISVDERFSVRVWDIRKLETI
jgi:WD40 repeat protein